MMTIEELVKRLRGIDYKTDLDEAAADALERQAKWLEGFVKHSDEMAIALSSEATRGEHLFVENSQLRARIAELEEREADALRGATILAVSLAEKHWPENMDWRPLDETAGVITQINNMCAGLDARIAELEAALKNWDALIRHQYTGSCEAMSDMTVCAQETAKLLYGPGPWPIYTARAALKGET